MLALRSFPIRVGGNSVPLQDEITWNEVQRRSGYPHKIAELHTTTTKRLRRVAVFNWDVVLAAVAANGPTALALHGADYLSYGNKGVVDYSMISDEARDFIVNWNVGLECLFCMSAHLARCNREIIDRRRIGRSERASVRAETGDGLIRLVQ